VNHYHSWIIIPQLTNWLFICLLRDLWLNFVSFWIRKSYWVEAPVIWETWTSSWPPGIKHIGNGQFRIFRLNCDFGFYKTTESKSKAMHFVAWWDWLLTQWSTHWTKSIISSAQTSAVFVRLLTRSLQVVNFSNMAAQSGLALHSSRRRSWWS